MTAPLVSVCMPVYNGMPYVVQAVDSVLQQTFGDFELIIADNCSDDGTAEVLAALDDPRVRLLRNETNIGAIPNWNVVLDQARGQYVKLLPADDVLYPQCLERQVAVLEEHDDVVLVAAKRDVIDAGGRPLIKGHGLGHLRGKVGGDTAVRAAVRAGANLFGEPGSTMVRRASLPPPPVLIEDLPYVVDLRLWCALLSRGSLFAIAETLSAFRITGGSQSVALARMQRRHIQELLQSVAGEVGATPADIRVGLLRATVRTWLRRMVFVGAGVRRRLPAARAAS